MEVTDSNTGACLIDQNRECINVTVSKIVATVFRETGVSPLISSRTNLMEMAVAIKTLKQ